MDSIADSFFNNTAAGTQSAFWLFSGTNTTRFSGNVAYNSTNGFYIDSGPRANNFTNNTIYSNTYGMRFNGASTYNQAYNNTLRNNSYGVYLAAASTNNLFYYNRFENSTYAHASALAAGNSFNTTNGSSCGAFCARGNYWDDILSLDIVDSNADGFGDSGTEYPYNRTNGGNVTFNVTDYGPITTNTGGACYDTDGDGSYNTSSDPGCSAYFDCDDNNATLLPPRDDYVLTQNITLCAGTYYVNDSVFGPTEGVIYTSSGAYAGVQCNGTVVIGNNSNTFIYNAYDTLLYVRNCTVANYTKGLRGATGRIMYNNFSNDTYGIYLNYYDAVISNNTFYKGSTGIWHDDFTSEGTWNITISYNDFLNQSQAMNTRSQESRFIHNNIQNAGNSGGSVTIYNYYSSKGGWNISYNMFNDSAGIIFNSGRPNTNVTHNSFLGNSIRSRGMYFFGSRRNDNFLIHANNFSGYTSYGVQASYIGNSIFTNNTFTDNAVGLYVSFEDNVLAYHNRFYSSSVMHASSGISSAYFNTTNTGKPAGYQAEGNYWDDILSLDIYDSDADGFGDMGPDYPYNSTNGGNVSADVQDWGPITTKGVPVPGGGNISITIFGPNGTEMTGTRSVFLNLSYNDSVVAACRWANDDSGNLASQPWEECTTVKAWLISPAEGNKTVYFQVRNTDGGTNMTNDSIIYSFVQDYTAPNAPIVLDGIEGDDIDWWNSNTTLHAHWSGGWDDISALRYSYRILNNSVCSGSCGFTDVETNTSVTVTGLDLSEGRNFSFEVMAYNPFNFNSSTALSDGVVIDLTRPDAPTINSSTHPDQNRPYDESSAVFNITADDPISNGVASGIAGYSYMLDTHPGTAPDNLLEEKEWETIAELHKGSSNQTLKANSTGYAYAVFSQLHANFTENDSVRVKVALAERFNDYRDLMGVKVYLAKIGDGVDISDFDMESAAITDIANFSWDVKYKEAMLDASVYQFDLTLNQTINDDGSNDIYVVVAGIGSDDDNRENLDVAYTTNAGLIDSSTKNFVCDQADVCRQNTTTREYSIGVERRDPGDVWTVKYDLLGDGVYYFHAKAKDDAGNWGETAHYRIEVAAGGVNVLVYSPYDGELFTTNTTAANITVKVAVSGNASVYVVAKHPGGGNYTSPVYVFNMSRDFEDVELELGSNEIYAVANTTAGAVSRSPSVFVTAAAGVPVYLNKTLRVRYTGCAQSSPAFICNAVQGVSNIGIATENAASISAPSVTTDTSVNSLKIYMTRAFDTGTLASAMQDNTFMDRVQPMFGYTRGVSEYVVRNELRYGSIYLGGNFRLPSGTYNLYMRKGGITPDGKSNITLTLE
jgi:parallel beta-helix repeat protein